MIGEGGVRGSFEKVYELFLQSNFTSKLVKMGHFIFPLSECSLKHLLLAVESSLAIKKMIDSEYNRLY